MSFHIPSDKDLQIQTARLVLEPVTEAHAQDLFVLLMDEELHTYVPFEASSLEQQKQRCARWAKRISPDGEEIWLNWVARHQESGMVAGHFQAGVRRDQVASVGYVVARSFQGKGFATEAMSAVFDLLKTEFAVKEVKAWSDTRNIASHKLAKKLGMNQIQVVQGADFLKGNPSDEFVFSLVFPPAP
jgi:RimJ/RimL family protein N-acetyltransferase